MTISQGAPVADVAVIIGRNLRRLVRVPTLLAFATIQPILFVVLWTYGFGGAIQTPGVANYIDYLLPGILVLSLAFGASQTGVAIADDMATGMIDRFRTLPMTRSAVLAGRTLADAVRNLFVLTLMIGLGYALGFRFHGGLGSALGVVGLALLIGFTFSWVNALIGMVVTDAESAGLAGLFPVIALVFTSSTFVPITTMPAWLEAFAEINPITVTVDALRALTLGQPASEHVWQALAWIAVILVVTIPTAVHRYRRATTE